MQNNNAVNNKLVNYIVHVTRFATYQSRPSPQLWTSFDKGRQLQCKIFKISSYLPQTCIFKNCNFTVLPYCKNIHVDVSALLVVSTYLWLYDL